MKSNEIVVFNIPGCMASLGVIRTQTLCVAINRRRLHSWRICFGCETICAEMAHRVIITITITTITITIMAAMCVCIVLSRLNRWHTCDGIKADCGMRRDALLPCAPSFRQDFRVSPKWICAVSNLRVVQVDYERTLVAGEFASCLRGAWRFSRTNISSLRAKYSAICFWPRSFVDFFLFFFFYFVVLLLLLLKAEDCRHYTAPLQP